MKRALLAMAVLGAAGCGDDGGNKVVPDTVLDDVPAQLSKDTHVRITFHAAGNANNFQCTLDGGAPTQCISPFEQDVAEGQHTFAVAAMLNQRIDDSPATVTWKIDATAPDTAIDMGPAALDNTLSPTITFSGTDPGGGAVTFECRIDGAAFAACTTPDQLTVADGAHAFEVRAVDAAGNPDPTPAQHLWTVDSSTPDTTITSGPATGSTSGADVSFAFESPDSTATFDCQLDAAAFAACTSPQAFTGLADGAHTFTVRANNAAGTVDPTPATRTWTVDGTPPNVTIVTHPVDPSNDATPAFTFSSADATATFACQIDGAPDAACTSPWTSGALADGPHMFRVRATDPVGNTGTDATFAWTVDTMAPTVTISGGPMTTVTATSAAFPFTTAGNPVSTQCSLDGAAFATCASPASYAALADGPHTVVVRATDAAGNTGMDMRMWTVDTMGPGVAITMGPTNPTADNTPSFTFMTTGGAVTIECSTGGAFAACTSPFTAAALADGPHTVTVRAFDAVGNTGSDSRTFTIDTAPPVVTIVTKPANPTAGKTGAFTFTASEGAPQCKLDGGPFAACTSPVAYPNLADGSHTFTVQSADPLGNTGSATYTWSIDTSPPAVTIATKPANPTASKTGAFTFTASEGAPQCKLDGGAFAACTSPVSYPNLADGSHTFTVQSADALGNLGSATYTWSIDTAPPAVAIVTKPANPTASKTGAFTFTASEGAPQCKLDGGAFAACTSPVSYPGLADGSHTFTVQSADALGNLGSATYTWSIDTAGPSVTITQLGPTTDTTPTISFSVSADAVSATCKIDSGAPAACTAPSFTAAPLADGSHTLLVTALDALGNPGSASMTFSIDTTGPTVTITPVTPNPTSDTTPAIAFSVTADAVSATCKVDTTAAVSCAAPSYTTPALGDGMHTLLVTALDALGNPGSASTTFSIDATGPVVTFDAQPPASWPVNYFDMAWHANETATYECSVNGAAFGACTTPLAVTTTRNGTASTFAVRGKDALGNVGAAKTATWTSSTGLVLHYPWEQGRTRNTSLLTQVAAYSPDGSATLPVVGGWAGSAAGSPAAHTYPNTIRALSSSPDGTYTVSLWFRATTSANGVLWSTANGTTGGHRVSINGGVVTLEVFQAGQTFSIAGQYYFDQWNQIEVIAAGPTGGAQLMINGNAMGTAAATTTNGFGAGQATNLTVGPVTGVDLDDLRFYNQVYAGNAFCTTVLRGVIDTQGTCIPNQQLVEVDFEGGRIINSGKLANYADPPMAVVAPTAYTFVSGILGSSLDINGSDAWGLTNYPPTPTIPGHTLTLWVNGESPADTLVETRRNCADLFNNGTCSIAVSWTANRQFAVFTGLNISTQITTTVPAAPLAVNRRHSLVLAEQGDGTNSNSVRIYVDGTLAATVPLPPGNLFNRVWPAMLLPTVSGVVIDEVELWPRDLSTSPEVLCENGFDGEWDPVASSCRLTSN